MAKKTKLKLQNQKHLHLDLLIISEFAAMAKVHTNTLRRWHKEGKLLPQYVSKKGNRYYIKTQLKMAVLLKKEWLHERQMC